MSNKGDKKTIQPIGYRVLVKPTELENKSVGGLVIPPSAQEGEQAALGEVVKLGIAPDMEFQVKEGDVIFFKKYSKEEITVDGEEYYIVEADDILAIIK